MFIVVMSCFFLCFSPCVVLLCHRVVVCVRDVCVVFVVACYYSLVLIVALLALMSLVVCRAVSFVACRC